MREPHYALCCSPAACQVRVERLTSPNADGVHGDGHSVSYHGPLQLRRLIGAEDAAGNDVGPCKHNAVLFLLWQWLVAPHHACATIVLCKVSESFDPRWPIRTPRPRHHEMPCGTMG